MTQKIGPFDLRGVLSKDPEGLPEFEPLHISVRNKLRRLILEEKIPNGLALREEALAKELGVSRGPIREAINQLSIEGLVEIVPRKGAFVHWVAKDDLEELVLIRAGIEAAALRLAMKRNLEELVAELTSAVEEIDARRIQDDWQGLLEAEVRFHDVIYAKARSQRITVFWSQLRPQVIASIRNDRAFISQPGSLVETHQELRDVIASGDLEAAATLLRRHIQPVSRLGEIDGSAK